MAPMTNRVKVYNYFSGLIISTNNFAFEAKEILDLESPHLESWVDERTAEQTNSRTAAPPKNVQLLCLPFSVSLSVEEVVKNLGFNIELE